MGTNEREHIRAYVCVYTYNSAHVKMVDGHKDIRGGVSPITYLDCDFHREPNGKTFV